MTKQLFFIICIFILSSQKNLYVQQSSKDGFLFKFYPQLQNAFQIFLQLWLERKKPFSDSAQILIFGKIPVYPEFMRGKQLVPKFY